MVFAKQGESTFSGSAVEAGSMFSDGNGNLNISDDRGVTSSVDTTGTYGLVDSFGRSVVRVNLTPPIDHVLYLSADATGGAAAGFIMEINQSSVSFGEVEQQSLPTGGLVGEFGTTSIPRRQEQLMRGLPF
jgi:hypothetical protein